MTLAANPKLLGDDRRNASAGPKIVAIGSLAWPIHENFQQLSFLNSIQLGIAARMRLGLQCFHAALLQGSFPPFLRMTGKPLQCPSLRRLSCLPAGVVQEADGESPIRLRFLGFA